MTLLKSRAFAAWDRPREALEITEHRIHDGVTDHQSLVDRAFSYIDTLASLFPYSRPPRHSVLLEVGSGLGYIMEAAAARFEPALVIGLDVAPSMAAKARSRLVRDHSAVQEKLRFLLYDGVSIPLRDESVDYIYSVASLQHVPKPFVYNLFYELLRVLKKDGGCNLQLLSANHIGLHETQIGFQNELMAQIEGRDTHWHHFYSFDELFYILADAVKVRQLNIVDGESAISVAFGKCGEILKDDKLIYSTHLGMHNCIYAEKKLAEYRQRELKFTRFHIDQCDAEQVSGWIDQDGPTGALTVEINGHWVCDLSPTRFRVDLLDAGLGDGRRAFSFPLIGHLSSPENQISLKLRGQEFYSAMVTVPRNKIFDPGSGAYNDLHAYSQHRWKGDEDDALLTWGSIFDAESLWKIYTTARTFDSGDHILEIGPGYGRLLATAIKLAVPFASYVGLELSESRVRRLSSRFNDDGIAFVVGDVDIWRGDRAFDVILCSSTFEHLYPDCRKALRNLRTQLSGHGWVFIDFIDAEETRCWFERDTAFVRCYPEAELRATFSECGFAVLNVVPCVLGTGATGHVITRNVVVARGVHPSFG